MKKRLMAMLVAAAMLVCMMPAMAFADEAPAEEQTVQATEEVVVPEAAEEEAVAPEAEGAVLEEEAVVEEAEVEGLDLPQYGGYWSGSTFYFTGNDLGAGLCSVYINYRPQLYDIQVGANDFSAKLEEFAPTNAAILIEVKGASSAMYRAQEFVMLKTKVAVDKAASKDTIFTYALDSIIVEKAENIARDSDVAFYMKDPSELTDYTFDFYGNTITLKAGETTAEGYLQLAINTTVDLNDKDEYRPYGCLVKETGNDGGYATDTALGAWSRFSVGIDPEETGHLYARFANRAEAQAFFDKVADLYNTKSGDLAELLTSTFNLTEMTFTHTPTATGVQTGDSNSLGLWVVVMAVAGVAAAAVALKRREN